MVSFWLEAPGPLGPMDIVHPVHPVHPLAMPLHQTISGCSTMEGRKFLFNDALNTFYLRLYGVGHMVKYHSDSERGNPLPPHGLLFLISSKGSFICTIPHRIAHTTAFVTPVVEHCVEREIAQWVHLYHGAISHLM